MVRRIVQLVRKWMPFILFYLTVALIPLVVFFLSGCAYEQAPGKGATTVPKPRCLGGGNSGPCGSRLGRKSSCLIRIDPRVDPLYETKETKE